MSEVINFYLLAATLKNKIRTGWKYWNVSAERLESIAEHIYGTCILAIGVESEYNLNINLYHVIKMLVVHELEEVKIGDYTPFDNISSDEKLIKGKKGVEWILGDLIKKQEYIDLLDEFNLATNSKTIELATREAKFAYLCDKLEADIQAKVYDDEYKIDKNKALPKMMASTKIQNLLSKGVTDVGDIWIEYDRDKFEDNRMEFNEIFLTLLNELKSTDTFQLKKPMLKKL